MSYKGHWSVAVVCSLALCLVPKLSPLCASHVYQGLLSSPLHNSLGMTLRLVVWLASCVTEKEKKSLVTLLTCAPYIGMHCRWGGGGAAVVDSNCSFVCTIVHVMWQCKCEVLLKIYLTSGLISFVTCWTGFAVVSLPWIGMCCSHACY